MTAPLPWSDFTVEEWAEQLLSIGSLRDAIELESRARELEGVMHFV